jgi:hypothetical protein
MYSPGLAGREVIPEMLPVGWTSVLVLEITTVPAPLEFIVYKPGESAVAGMLTNAEPTEFRSTWMLKIPLAGACQGICALICVGET